ncbi:MAG: T9SS type A sorting domain-containing protein [bacterium]|nr:T9SS type A sorting domain-containing protein [bacterium]
MTTTTLRGTLVAAASALWLATAASAATITIVNADGVDEGFNDPTPASPIGGNTGTTIGEQRLIAFQFAADVWGALLPSEVEISITAAFDPLTCNASSAVLGSAGPWQVFSDFAGAPLPATWYAAALANKLAGVDLAPGDPNTNADDLQARFNSSIDNNVNCLAGSDWYYGLDGNHGTDVDLVVVLLHEFAHGLGFSSLVNKSTGALYSGQDDVFSNFLYDNDYGLHWPDLTDLDRSWSATNTQRVAFDGPQTIAAADALLGFAPELAVSAPAGVAGTYALAEAAFGPSVDEQPVSGFVVQALDGTSPPGDACQSVVNAAALNGNIALVDRGACAYTVKVQAAQNAGAIGVIVVNSLGGPPVPMAGVGESITIPTVMVSLADGNLLKAQLANGVVATMQTSLTRRAGLDAGGRPLVYTPDPVQSGSSVSHFDVSALPNLLMEPTINVDLVHDGVDLTLAVFRDLGWLNGAPTPAPAVPGRTLLRQNAPNPFNPSTTIRFTLADGGDTRLKVFDVRGQHVRELVAGGLAAGEHAVTWDGRDDAGATMPSGIYFYRLQSGDFTGMQRMLLLK